MCVLWDNGAYKFRSELHWRKGGTRVDLFAWKM